MKRRGRKKIEIPEINRSFLGMTGINPLENRPKITDWFNRTRDQLEPYFTEHHKYVYVVADIIKNQGFPDQE